MKFTVVVQGNPWSSEACHSALAFCRAVIEQKHELVRVFFYHDGVLAANHLSAPPQDEQDLVTAWQDLVSTWQVDLTVCIASCLRRGILDETEADRYAKSAQNIASGFNISGLGQLVDATLNSDRVITFGA